MTAIFHDMVRKEMEVYVDDILVKSHTCKGHVEAHALRRMLERARKFNLRMNPKKCVFGVGSGKLLEFIVNRRGIEIDPTKVKAIYEMPPTKDLKELCGFLSKLQFADLSLNIQSVANHLFSY